MVYLRRRRTRLASDERRLRPALCGCRTGPRPDAFALQGVQVAALPLGVRCNADSEAPLELADQAGTAGCGTALPLPDRLVLLVRRCVAPGVHRGRAGVDH